MPEGDTAWRTARNLELALVGRRLVRSDIRVPAFAAVDLSGERVEASFARGKHLLLRVGERWTVHSHLRMEGAWHVYAHGERWRRPAHQARIVLDTEDRQAVGFELGVLELLGREREAQALDYLGPDILAPDWDADAALDRLLGDPGVPVFVALHDQRRLAGLGNEYVTELCFVSGVDPRTPVGVLGRERMIAMLALARRMITANRDRVERTFTGDTRPGRRTWVFGREGQPCRRCGTAVQRTMLGADALHERVACWCPRCQPMLAP